MDASVERHDTTPDQVDNATKKIEYPSIILQKELPIELRYGDEFSARVFFRVKEITNGELYPDEKSRQYRLVLEVRDIMPEKPSTKGLPKPDNYGMTQYREHAPRDGFPMQG